MNLQQGTQHLQQGTLLQGGKYRIERFIKSGGFGCTYEARIDDPIYIDDIAVVYGGPVDM